MIIKAQTEHLQDIIDMHMKYIDRSFFSLLGGKFLYILYESFIKSKYARLYVYVNEGKVSAYIAFLLSRKMFFAGCLKNNFLKLFVKIEYMHIIKNIQFLFETFLYLFGGGLCDSELMFISVCEKDRSKHIASDLIDNAEMIYKEKNINKIQVSINDDNKICRNIIISKNYIPLKTVKLYGKIMQMYYKKL